MIKGEKSKMSMVLGRYVELSDLVVCIADVGTLLTSLEGRCSACEDEECDRDSAVNQAIGGLKAVSMLLNTLGITPEIAEEFGAHMETVEVEDNDIGGNGS